MKERSGRKKKNNVLVPPTADQAEETLIKDNGSKLYLNKLLKPLLDHKKVVKEWPTKDEGIKFWL